MIFNLMYSRKKFLQNFMIILCSILSSNTSERELNPKFGSQFSTFPRTRPTVQFTIHRYGQKNQTKPNFSTTTSTALNIIGYLKHSI